MPRNEPTAIISVRVPVALRDAIDAVVRRHLAAGDGPRTLRDATVAAYLLWLQAEGDTPPAVVPPRMGRPPVNVPPEDESKRPVGRPPKPPFALPEGTDAVAVWREFWTIARTKGWPAAAGWATRQYHTDIDSWHHAMQAALPADYRHQLTAEELGVPTVQDQIDREMERIGELYNRTPGEKGKK